MCSKEWLAAMLTYEINVLCDGKDEYGRQCTEIEVTEPNSPCDPQEAYRLALARGWKITTNEKNEVLTLCPDCAANDKLRHSPSERKP